MFTFTSVRAVELVEARTEVIESAIELFEDQYNIWCKKKTQDRPNKERHPTWSEAHEKMRTIRIRRERDANYWNDTTNPNP